MRLKLKSMFPTLQEFINFCRVTVGEFYPELVDMANFNEISLECDRYVYKPLYRQFKNATCRYLPTEEGIEAFKDQFSNQLEEVVFDFLVYTSSNLAYFNEAYSKTGENLVQGVTTVNTPINQQIKNTKSNTEFAEGATSQSVNLLVYNGKTAWRNAFASYYTSQRKAELIDRFRWLFINFYVGEEQGVTLIEVEEELNMTEGNQVVAPVDNEIIRKITIIKPDTLVPENIKKGVNIGGVIGTMEENNMIKEAYLVDKNLISNNVISDTELYDKILAKDYDILIISIETDLLIDFHCVVNCLGVSNQFGTFNGLLTVNLGEGQSLTISFLGSGGDIIVDNTLSIDDTNITFTFYKF